jgi:fatty acid desaturase
MPFATGPGMRPRLLDLAVHLGRLAASMGVLALASSLASPAGMVAASALLFLEAFALVHDLAHGALLLPRRANEVALGLAGVLLLLSGHALRGTHLVHHARPLADDDLEGLPARGGFWQALAAGPGAALALRREAFRRAGRRGRALQAIETLAGAALVAAAIASGKAALVTYVVIALLGQATMSVWAAYVPHNTPAWLSAAAARLACTGSPTMLALAYHDLHHARPGIPCRLLGRAAARLPAATFPVPCYSPPR